MPAQKARLEPRVREQNRRRDVKAEAFVDEPLVNDELHDFGPVREGVREAGFVLFVFQLGVLLLQPLKPPDRNIRLRIELPLPDFCRGQEVLRHWPPCQAPRGANRDLPLPVPRSSHVSRPLQACTPIPWTRPLDL